MIVWDPKISTTRCSAYFCFHDWIYFNSTLGLFMAALDKAQLVSLHWPLVQYGLGCLIPGGLIDSIWTVLCTNYLIKFFFFQSKSFWCLSLCLWELAQSGVTFPFLSLHICNLFSSLQGLSPHSSTTLLSFLLSLVKLRSSLPSSYWKRDSLDAQPPTSTSPCYTINLSKAEFPSHLSHIQWLSVMVHSHQFRGKLICLAFKVLPK